VYDVGIWKPKWKFRIRKVNMSILLSERRLLYLALALSLPPALARADVVYNVSGTYDGSTVSSPVAAPNTAFTMTFDIPTPVVPAFSNSMYFHLVGENVTFTLGGGGPETLTGVGLAFYTTGSLAGTLEIDCELSLCNLATADNEDFEWDFEPSTGTQLFSGPTSAPTMLTGSFPIDTAPADSYYSDSINGSGAGHFTTATVVASSVAAVPEPSSVALFGTVLLFGLGALRRRFPR